VQIAAQVRRLASVTSGAQFKRTGRTIVPIPQFV
jgi:hypothetical protein